MEENKTFKEPPFWIHGDIENVFPTHTHGMTKYDLPEMFINNSAFGAIENARLINEIFVYLKGHPEDANNIINRLTVEIDLYGPEFGKNIIIRPVDNKFIAVQMAYPDECMSSIYKFSQIYVEGDNHVLTDEYYKKLCPHNTGLKCSKCQGH